MTHERLIPPDPPEVWPTVEQGERLRRLTHEDGTVMWSCSGICPAAEVQDRWEEAYEMGLKAAKDQVEALRAKAYGKGVVDAATTAYGGKRHHGNE